MNTDPHSKDEIIRQAYRAASKTEPSPQLDAHILRAAQTALNIPAKHSHRWSWLVLPLSAAAVAILVTTLILQARKAPAPALEQASANPPAQAAKPPAVPSSIVAQAPQPKAKFNIADAKSATDSAEHVDTAQKKQQRQNMVAAETALNMAHRGETPTLTGAAEPPKQKTPELKIAATELAAPTPAPAAVAAIPPIVASTPPSSAAMQQAPPTDAPADTATAQASQSQFASLGRLAKTRGIEKPTDKQIEEIRKLRREGDLDAAKKAMAELRKRYPLFKVPDDLRALIEPTQNEK